MGRVLAGAVCKQYLERLGVRCGSWVYGVGDVEIGREENEKLGMLEIKQFRGK